MKNCIIFILSMCIISFFPTYTKAHTGSRDELGGHFRSKDCMYLLHEPTQLAIQAKTIDELTELIKKYNSNSCKNTLTKEKIDIGNFSFEGDSNTVSSDELELGKRYEAQLESCTDGDTANFNIRGTIYKTRFLFIDTPESTIQKEAFGQEASDFTCSFLKKGKIILETDGNTLFDKYGRLLAWVFVGEELHQEIMTKNGLVEDFYDYGDYKYEDRIRKAMKEAKEKHFGIYASLKPAEPKKEPEKNPPTEKNEQTNMNDINEASKSKNKSNETNKEPNLTNSIDGDAKQKNSLFYIIGGLIIVLIIVLITKLI